ncbi:unnamed protein product [Microthlaspi erraticum]|uniref:BZIP domain-containing protein n=1 Tax=Microthlaspi erraticum TaxID=1685480 RepID=A0A6D2KYA8_9BRAS|nr:unnamed protein product [Microthlaspi erraticum]CAA7058291.1 unnamed protein product [Microthlaspi erraticum]
MTMPSFPVPTSFPVSNSDSQEGEKKASYVNYEVGPGFTIHLCPNFDPAMDPKKLKRIVSNRVAGQQSRWKKLQYVNDLEKRVRELHVSILRARKMILIEQNRRAERMNMKLKERLFAEVQHSIFLKGLVEALRAQAESLKK